MKYLLSLLLVYLLAMTSVCFAEGNAEAQAHKDIKNGNYKILLYGGPLAASLNAITYKAKTIKLERVAGCVVEEKQVAYWNAYNNVVQKELLDNKNIWELLDEVIAKSQKKNDP